MTTRTDVTIPADGGVTLAAWLYTPDGQGPFPGITMAHGFGAIKELGLDPVARAFADAGFVVLVHDHRTLGASGGEPRGDVNPWTQIADWRRVITYLSSLPEVADDRIGLWGTSFAGGHSIVLGATDHRLKAIVAQVPVTNGVVTGQRRVRGGAELDALERDLAADEQVQLRGEAPASRTLVSADPNEPAFYKDPQAVATYLAPPSDGGVFENVATLRSMYWQRMYAPVQWIEQVAPTPLLMIVGRDDSVSGTDLALTAFQRALEPKQLALIDGTHFDPYDAQLPLVIDLARAFFLQQLHA